LAWNASSIQNKNGDAKGKNVCTHCLHDFQKMFSQNVNFRLMRVMTNAWFFMVFPYFLIATRFVQEKGVACPCGLSALRQGDGPEYIKKQVNATKTKPVQKEN